MPLCNIAGVFAYRNAYGLLFTAYSEEHVDSSDNIVTYVCIGEISNPAGHTIVADPVILNGVIRTPLIVIVIFVCGFSVSVIGVNFNTFTIDIININRCVSVRSVVKLDHTVEK